MENSTVESKIRQLFIANDSNIFHFTSSGQTRHYLSIISSCAKGCPLPFTEPYTHHPCTYLRRLSLALFSTTAARLLIWLHKSIFRNSNSTIECMLLKGLSDKVFHPALLLKPTDTPLQILYPLIFLMQVFCIKSHDRLALFLLLKLKTS